MLAYPNISPVALSLGPVQVHWYGLMYLFAFLAGWGLARWRASRPAWIAAGWNGQKVDDLLTWIMLGVVAGGRLGYVLFYGQETYLRHPLQIFAVWHGGMSFHGGIAGVILALWYFSRKIKYPFLGLTDLVVLYAPIGIFLGRLANFVNDELWGRPADVPWAVKFPNGGYVPRHPSQLYEALTEGLLMFLILNWLWRYKSVRSRTGTVSAVFAVLYAVFRMSMEQFRQPDAQLGFFFGHVTMGQMLSLPLLIAGLAVLWAKLRPSRSRSA